MLKCLVKWPNNASSLLPVFLQGFLVAIVSILALVGSAESAGTVKDCDAALVRETSKTTLDIRQKLAILHRVDSEMFDEMKRNLQVGATIPIGGIPVTPEMDYKTFDQHRQKILSEYRFESNKSEYLDIFRSYLSPLAPDAYGKCLQVVKVGGGTSIWQQVGTPGDTTLAFTIGFNTVDGDTTRREFLVKVPEGGTILTADRKLIDRITFTGNRAVTVHVVRPNVQIPVRITVNTLNAGHHGTASLYIPGLPRVSKYVSEERFKCMTLPLHAQAGVYHSGSQCMTADIGDGFHFKVPQSVSLSVTHGGYVRDCSTAPTDVKADRVCQNAIVNPQGGMDASCTIKIAAVQERWTWRDVDEISIQRPRVPPDPLCDN